MSALILVDSVMRDHERKMKANTAVLMLKYNLHMIQNVSTKQVIE